jgi:hypothetical protein
MQPLRWRFDCVHQAVGHCRQGQLPRLAICAIPLMAIQGCVTDAFLLL